ncbi:MAG: hypothetical protein RAP70_08170 [Candidatus Celaenobacter antarcticus]|nr:hypothetical protein [Candidatus Celaenobacter antarcticus]
MKTINYVILAFLVIGFLWNSAVFSTQATITSPDVQLLKYDPLPAEAGAYVNVWIKIENTGSSSLRDVICTLVEEYPFSLDPNENAKRDIGTLPKDDWSILQYKVRVADDAVSGWNELALNCSTNQGKTSKTFEINIKSGSAFAVGSITADPSKMTSDMKDAKLTVEIQNVGEADAKLITVQLNPPVGFTPSESYSDRVNLGTIESGSSKNAVFYLDVAENVLPGAHNASITIQYGINGKYVSKELPLQLFIKNSALFKIEQVQTNPTPLAVGSKAEVKVTLKNIGYEEAKSVSLRIYKKSDQPFEINDNYDYIGNLQPNESSIAIFQMDVSDTADIKDYLLDVEFRYINGDEVNLVAKTISVEVGTGKGLNLLFFVVPVIVIGIIVPCYIYYRREKS